MKVLCFAILAAAASGAAAEPVRCQVDGRTVYQQTPCSRGDGQAVNTSGAGIGDPSSPGARQAAREVAEYRHLRRVEAAIEAREVFVGMAPKDVVASWGRPESIDRTVTAHGVREQWVYRRGRLAAQYVYLDDGVVTSIQTRN